MPKWYQKQHDPRQDDCLIAHTAVALHMAHFLKREVRTGGECLSLSRKYHKSKPVYHISAVGVLKSPQVQFSYILIMLQMSEGVPVQRYNEDALPARSQIIGYKSGKWNVVYPLLVLYECTSVEKSSSGSRNLTVNDFWPASIIALVPCNHRLLSVSHYSGLGHDLRFIETSQNKAFILLLLGQTF